MTAWATAWARRLSYGTGRGFRSYSGAVKLSSHRHRRHKQKVQQNHAHRLLLPLAAGWLSLSLAWPGATARLCAQALPATPPTARGGQTPSSPPQALTSAASSTPNPPHRAQIVYANGLLQVRADNSSLNQILRTLSQQTGLKITGGVQEQRVFGDYGPASLSTVLSTLLDGAGANIMILAGDAQHPPQLILTPATGGPEPPSPDSPVYAIYDQSNDREAPVPPPATPGAGSSVRGGLPGSAAAQPAIPSVISHALPTSTPAVTPAATPAGRPLATTAVAPSTQQPVAAGGSTAASPARVLTPEMVEQELMKMQEQQAAQQKVKLKDLNEKVQQEQLQAAKASAAGKSSTNPTNPANPTGSAAPASQPTSSASPQP